MRIEAKFAVGEYEVVILSADDALSLDAIAQAGVETALLPASRAMPDAPSWSVSTEQAVRLVNGQALPAAGQRAECIWVYDSLGRLVCLASADGTLVRPRLIL